MDLIEFMPCAQKKTTARFERWPWLVVDLVTRQYERVAVDAENNLVGRRAMQNGICGLIMGQVS